MPNAQSSSARPGKVRNSDRGIVRYEWLEAVVRLAMGRFQAGAVPRATPQDWVSKAVQKLITEHLIPQSGAVDRVATREKLSQHQASTLVRALLTPLHRVFQFYRHPKTGYISLPTLLHIMHNSEVIDKFLTRADVKLIFVQTAPLMVDEMRSDRHRSADFMEFCEFVAAAALSRLEAKTQAQVSAAAKDTGALFGSSATELTYKMTLALLVKQMIKFMEQSKSGFALRTSSK